MTPSVRARPAPTRDSVPTIRREPSYGVPLAVAAGVLFGAVALIGVQTPGFGLPLVMILSTLVLVGALTGQVERLLLAIILLELPLTYDVHLFYKEEMDQLGALGGLNLSVMTVALLGLYVLWLLRVLARVESPGGVGPSLRASRTAIAYVLVSGLTCLVAQDPLLASFQLGMLLQVLLLFIYVTRWVRTRSDVLFVVTFLLLGLGLEGLTMALLWFAGESLSLPGLTALVGPEGRVGGTIGSPNIAAGYLALFLGTALGVLLGSARRSLKILAACAALLGTLGLVVTLSRGGWLAFAVCCAVICLVGIRKGWISPFVVVGGVLAALFVAVVFQQGILARAWTARSAAEAYSRVPLMQLAFRMILANPVFGVGLNNFAAAIETYATGGLYFDWLYTVHNQYLLVWAESGPIALIAFLAFLGTALRGGWKAYRIDDPVISPLAVGMSAGLIGHMVQMMTEAFVGKAPTEGLWLTAALLGVLAPATLRTSPEESGIGP